MKTILFIYFFLCLGNISYAQKLNLTIISKNETDNKIINSIGYQKEHANGKSVVDAINTMSDNLTKEGYLENKIINNIKTNDSTFVCTFFIGIKVDFIHIYIGENSLIKSLTHEVDKNDTIIIAYQEVEPFLKNILYKLESQGYALSKLKLVDIKKDNNILTAVLELNTEKQRQLNNFVIKGYDKFPKGFRQNFIRSYKNEVFNQDNLNKIYKDFEKIRFVKQVKYPEILFEKDSTKIYIYLEKTKINSFDGFLGFANDTDGKLTFNGFLDLNLINTLNSGEILSIFWKNDGGNQKSFNAAVELPYIFKSPIGLKASLNIFKQDSTFQNTRTAINLGYYFKYNSRLFLGYQSTESSAISNQNTSNLSDYENFFAISNYEFIDTKREDLLFPIKTNIYLKLGIGNRISQTASSNQIFANIILDHNFYLNRKNILNIKSQNYYLQSKEYLVNELYRFGGIYSIQGFREDSLQGNLFTSILTEYRYVFTNTTYVYSIIDYGYFQDQSTDNQGRLLGLGIGFGLLTKNGLFNLAYATGSSNNNSIELANSIVHVSFKTIF